MKPSRRITLFGAALALSAFCLHAQESGQEQQQINPAMLERLAEQGNADAQFELGVRLLGGEGVEKDVTKAVKWLQFAADQHNLGAMNALGTLHEEGIGLPKDEKLAFEWYEKAAKYGFPLAQQNLSECYEVGKGVEKNTEEAVKWLERAAHQDFAPSQALYAWRLERGAGLEKNTKDAAQWYLRAAQNGLVRAMTHLAYMYYVGVGVPLDYSRAEAWYRRAARSEDPWARNDLAWFLAVCPDEDHHDGETAVDFARSSVEKLEGKDYQVIDTLAAALARAGKFGEAVQLQMKTIVMFSSLKDEETKGEDRAKLEQELNERLLIYKKQTPFTEKEPKPEAGTKPLIEDRILQEENLPRRKAKPQQKSNDDEDDDGQPVVIS
jgi:TPR repeat protein